MHRPQSWKPKPETSVHVPEDLPDVGQLTIDGSGERSAEADHEEKWEARALLFASQEAQVAGESVAGARRSFARRSVSAGSVRTASSAGSEPDETAATEVSVAEAPVAEPSAAADEDIHRAIELHEQGDYTRATELFGRLADPAGDNNPLAQVLYGLALRHGWGVEPSPDRAITYLRLAASNSALIEEQTRLARQAMKDPRQRRAAGAKGELVLAIFELGNCFRFGWGVDRDPVAAKHYYETAAHLGDPDAMTEVAWCLLEGFGCKKDKFRAAQFYRMAEKAGKVEVGQSWIWKEKYDPRPDAGATGGKTGGRLFKRRK
ncbi:uncharacterized protein V1510DRAFT_363916 [Dipodascopsis tothii]|uniref:uncharacterized protein n=1 Tax=Dipodascopsis tothii TaxID=44089 RepID=UPI0034CE0062